MGSFREARMLGALLRLSRSVDIGGDVIVRVDSPARLVSWASTIPDISVVVGHATGGGQRYVQVTAHRLQGAGGGRIVAVLDCADHGKFWRALAGDELEPDTERRQWPPAC